MKQTRKLTRSTEISETFSSKERMERDLLFSVALVEPEFPLNVGYVARVMANFGMTRLIIVSRRKMSIKDAKLASKFASHGSFIIDKMKYAVSLSILRNRYQFLIGTTAIQAKRKSNLTRKTLTPEECAKSVLSLNGGLKRNEVCFVFGRDTTGLTNEELEQCDYSITIRTGTGYNTLNISHACAVIFYAFSRADQQQHPEPMSKSSTTTATRVQREMVIDMFEELAILSDFQKFKQGKLRETLNRLLNRSNPSLRELYLLMGLANKAKTKIKNRKSML